MENLDGLEDLVLIDMLAEYTQEYTRLFRNFMALKDHPEYLRCKENIIEIIAELAKRGMLSHTTTNIQAVA
jgi:hypothetical protein